MSGKKRVNSNVSACLKDCKLFENSDFKMSHMAPATFKNEANYQKSFDDIIKFSKSIPIADKKAINCCIYNKNNDDGLFSAWVYYKFVDSKVQPIFIPLSPSSGNTADFHLKKHLNDLKDKTVIIVDLAYSVANLKLIASVAKSIYIVDDHPRSQNELKALETVNKAKNRWFIGDDKHSAVAYTWKFFFPEDPVPILVQYIDNDDRKLQLPHLFYDRAFKTYISYRITHSPYIKKFTTYEAFEKLDEQLKNVDKNFMLTIGHYYDEVVNNIKDQVARNASFQYFQGHPVYVLNYNDPVLYKMVARQMITNAEKANKKIDFAVLWGWEYTTNAYKVFLSEKHTNQQPKFNLPNMARALAKKGGHPHGGHGTRFIANFYWPRKPGFDIWDLFTKNRS